MRFGYQGKKSVNDLMKQPASMKDVLDSFVTSIPTNSFERMLQIIYKGQVPFLDEVGKLLF